MKAEKQLCPNCKRALICVKVHNDDLFAWYVKCECGFGCPLELEERDSSMKFEEQVEYYKSKLSKNSPVPEEKERKCHKCGTNSGLILISHNRWICYSCMKSADENEESLLYCVMVQVLKNQFVLLYSINPLSDVERQKLLDAYSETKTLLGKLTKDEDVTTQQKVEKDKYICPNCGGNYYSPGDLIIYGQDPGSEARQLQCHCGLDIGLDWNKVERKTKC